jgi:hypothetical protein
MSTNQSQSRMRLHPILLHSRFHQKPAASPGFGAVRCSRLCGASAGFTRSVFHPSTPHLRREFPKRRVSFTIFPTHKNDDLPSLQHLQRDLHSTHRDLQRDLHRDTRTTIPTPSRPEGRTHAGEKGGGGKGSHYRERQYTTRLLCSRKDGVYGRVYTVANFYSQQ